MSLPDQFRDALTMVSAAGQRGRLVREIVDIHEDGHIRSWLWRQLLASPTLVGFADESCAVDPGAPLDDSTRGLRLVATPIQREVFLGIYNRNISLSSAQLSLLEAIGSGMDRGVARSDIDEFMGTMQNKEFFRNCKTLIGRNLIVRVNEFTGALRPGKFAPPFATLRWYLKRFSPVPLPIRASRSLSAASSMHDHQQRAALRRWIDHAVVPLLVNRLAQRAPQDMFEEDLESFAVENNLLEGIEWVSARERLFATRRVQWVYVPAGDGVFRQGFRLVEQSEDCALEENDDVLDSNAYDRPLTYEELMTPPATQMYRIIDESGSLGTLTCTLFRMLKMNPRHGTKILRELLALPGDDAVVQVADRYKTNMTYRLFRKVHIKDAMDRFGISDNGQAIVKKQSQGRKRRRASSSLMNSDSEQDGSEADEQDRAGVDADKARLSRDAVIRRRARWIRDVIDVRKIATLNTLVHLVRHREAACSAICAALSVRTACEDLEQEGVVVVRTLDDVEDTPPVIVVVSTDLDPDHLDTRRAMMEEAIRFDPYVESMIVRERTRMGPHGPSETFMIAYPTLCGFVKPRMLRVKLLHLHIVEMTLARRPYSPHWYLQDLFQAMPLSLYLMVAGVVDAIPEHVLYDESMHALPISRLPINIRRAMMSSLLNGTTFNSLRVQDVLEVGNRMGIFTLTMPSAYPATWQVTLNAESPLVTIASLADVHSFWSDLRLYCQSVILTENPTKVAGVAVPWKPPPDLVIRAGFADLLPLARFPEVYNESSWVLGYDMSDNKVEMILQADSESRIVTEAALNRLCVKVNASTGKVAWRLARLHLPFAEQFHQAELCHDWRPTLVDQRRVTYSVVKGGAPKESVVALLQEKPQRKKRERPVEPKPTRRRKRPRRSRASGGSDLRSLLCIRRVDGDDDDDDDDDDDGQQEEEHVEEEDQQVDEPVATTDADGDDADIGSRRRSRRAVRSVYRERTLRLQKKLGAALPRSDTDDGHPASDDGHVSGEQREEDSAEDELEEAGDEGVGEVAEPEESGGDVLPEWTPELQSLMARVYGRSGSEADLAVAAGHPRLHWLLARLKLILIQRDAEYDASAAVALLTGYSDSEVKWACDVLFKAGLVVKRKHGPGSKPTRGHFAIARRAVDALNRPALSLGLLQRSSSFRGRLSTEHPLAFMSKRREGSSVDLAGMDLQTLLGQPSDQVAVEASGGDSARPCDGVDVALSLERCAHDRCLLSMTRRANDAVAVESNDVALDAVVAALDDGDVSPDRDDECVEVTRTPYRDDVEEALREAGVSGGTVAELAERSGRAVDLVQACLEELVLNGIALPCNEFAVERFLHANFADSGCVHGESPDVWRRLDGDIDDALINNVHWAILSAAIDRPGIDERTLAAMFPILTPLEFDAAIRSLVLDGRLRSRRLKRSRIRLLGTGSNTDTFRVFFANELFT
ncbi:B-block binding subunit of TFIIIC domain-containing protein [Plasmodiophora brassicae]|uniref:B-block binding subunit of TFIIIC domain-containing protein n=1 Tax=Plasmodiophora brassicae TaxID=37360 RepID=A0A0G4IKT9_PLABS|nr:hypothetical protein PBRA_004506 [Plasmodiophora brassicae]SPR00060.1 unnamed protein product [Plasmodiophora brassicae]